jgi:hypothetical protein
MKSKGGVTVSVITTGDKRNSTVSMSDQLSIPSISIASDYKPDFKITELSPSDSIARSSMDSFDFESQSQPHQLEGTAPTLPPASVTPHLPDMTKSIPYYASDVADTV